MAEKLSENTWTAFTRKQKLDLDDGALVKALGRFDKAPEDKPEPRAQALRDVVDEIRKQVASIARRRKELGDKPFGEAKDKLYALLEAAEALQKDVAKAAAAASKGHDEEDDGPALLTGKLASLLRDVRKGELVLHLLVAVAGKEAVVMLSRSPISPARGPLLRSQLANPGGLKFIRGECQFEHGVVTFVVQAPSGGLARRIREAIVRQTGMKLKIRVRGEDGEEQEGDEVAPDASSAPQAPAPATAAVAPEQLAYAQRWEALQPRLAKALREQHPEATRLRAVGAFAAEKAAAGDVAGAGKALDMMEKLLAAAPPTAATPAATVAVPPVSNVVFQQARLVWDASRKKALGLLATVQTALLADFKGTPELGEIRVLSERLQGLLARLDERLSDKLDEALNAADPQVRRQRHEEAAGIVREYRAFVQGDPGLRLLDENPFARVQIRQVYETTLNVLAAKLAA
jgi:hypothetical protein